MSVSDTKTRAIYVIFFGYTRATKPSKYTTIHDLNWSQNRIGSKNEITESKGQENSAHVKVANSNTDAAYGGIEVQ
jgi:hypothetical protein